MQGLPPSRDRGIAAADVVDYRTVDFASSLRISSVAIRPKAGNTLAVTYFGLHTRIMEPICILSQRSMKLSGATAAIAEGRNMVLKSTKSELGCSN